MKLCPFLHLLESWLRAELPAESSSRLEVHVEECPDCQRALDRLTTDTRFVRDHPTGSLGHTALLHARAGRPMPTFGASRPVGDEGSLGSLNVPTEDGLSSRPPSRFESLPTVRFGDFELLGILGRGGMGVVYQAHQRGPDRIVALKVLAGGSLAHPDELRRFRREAAALAALDHPNIVPILEVGEHEGRCFFAMPMIAGGSLADRLEDYRDEHRESALLMIDVARAVQHAHQRGLLHRDLKPANILIDERGRPNVTDFGLARWVDGATELTPTGAVLGSPPYMAPEQATGNRNAITILSDVYGLGAILYTLLTGRTPFRGDSAVQVIHRVVHEAPEPPRRSNPGIDRELECICLKCLEKEPKRRYGSAEALADDLERWVQGRPIKARPIGRFVRLGRWYRRSPAQARLVGCLALSILLGIGGILRPIGRANHEIRIARRVPDLLDELFTRDEPEVDRRTTLGEILDRAERRIQERAYHSPEVEATERWIIGSILLRIGESARAEQHLRIAHHLFLTLDGPGHFGAIQTSENLAQTLIERGRLDEAGPFARTAYEGSRTHIGPHEPTTLSTLLTLARWQQAVGHRKEADRNIREVLKRSRDLARPDRCLERRARALLASGTQPPKAGDVIGRAAGNLDQTASR